MDWVIEGLHRSAAMLWMMFWPLVFGLTISAFLQAFLSGQEMGRFFGKANPKSMLLATGLGAASSSCSYAATATARAAFARGAALAPSLAFMLAATNIVIELGILLWQFLGGVFVAAEVVGGLLMVAILWLLMTVSEPQGLETEARRHVKEQRESGQHHHGSQPKGKSVSERFKSRENWNLAGGAFIGDTSMLWKEVVLGMIIAGFLSVLVPKEWWHAVFLPNSANWIRTIENAVVGPLIAIASFVCSDGNVPLASLLWSNGIGFGGVVAFIYGDLLIVPLLLIYRKSFGLKAALYITGWLYVSMVAAALLVELLFGVAGWIPQGSRPASMVSRATFALDHTFWLNIAALGIAGGMILLHKGSHKAHQGHAAHEHCG